MALSKSVGLFLGSDLATPKAMLFWVSPVPLPSFLQIYRHFHIILKKVLLKIKWHKWNWCWDQHLIQVVFLQLCQFNISSTMLLPAHSLLFDCLKPASHCHQLQPCMFTSTDEEVAWWWPSFQGLFSAQSHPLLQAPLFNSSEPVFPLH